MVSMPYKGGTYNGSVKLVNKKQNSVAKKRTARVHKMIPHGSGSLEFNGVKYSGNFRNGFEEGLGTLTWTDGSSFVGSFKGGHPEPKILRDYHQSCVLKDQVKALQVSLARKQKELDECKQDLDIEKETTMAVALSLDRCQSKSQELYEFALSQEGINVAQLNAIHFS